MIADSRVDINNPFNNNNIRAGVDITISDKALKLSKITVFTYVYI